MHIGGAFALLPHESGSKRGEPPERLYIQSLHANGIGWLPR
jgi:hypothetical protein